MDNSHGPLYRLTVMSGFAVLVALALYSRWWGAAAIGGLGLAGGLERWLWPTWRERQSKTRVFVIEFIVLLCLLAVVVIASHGATLGTIVVAALVTSVWLAWRVWKWRRQE